MSGSIWAIIFIPVVVAIVLAVWISVVYYANRHPQSGHPEKPRHKVTGGRFRARGGRQVMPRRDATPPEAEKYESHADRERS